MPSTETERTKRQDPMPQLLAEKDELRSALVVAQLALMRLLAGTDKTSIEQGRAAVRRIIGALAAVKS